MNSPDKILVCHNKLEDCKDICKCLEKHDFTVFDATDRERTLELFLLEKPDILLLDMQYPDIMDIISLSGEEAIQCPVILMSDREEHIIEGLKLGAEDYIIKQGKTELLIYKIRKFLGQKKLKEQNKLLLEKEESYRKLIENINDVIFSVDIKGNVTYISSVIERISKYKVRDFTGKHVSDFVHPDDLPGLMERYRRIFEGEIKPYEYRLIDKDGRIIHIRSYSRPVYKNGIAAGLTGLILSDTS